MNNLYTLSLDSIKYILGLIRDTVDLPANILDDLHIQSTTTYSSYKLDTLLKALKEENIQYCDEAISKLNKLSKEIITDKLQITNENTIYLLLTDPVNNIYEQWLLINGTPQMIGTTEMKLDSVYTKDEADDRYALLTDFDTLTTSFNNLVTSVDKKIDKDQLITSITETATDDQIYSASIVNSELDNKVNKADIIDNLTSTDTNKPLSANQGKALDDKKLNKADADKITIINAEGVNIKDFILEKCTDKNKLYYITARHNCTDTPKVNANYFMTVENAGSFTIKVIAKELAGNNNEYVCTYRIDDAKWSNWEKVCTTKVADEADVNVTSSLDTSVATANNIQYTVKNGICFVRIDSLKPLVTCVETVILPSDTLPKSSTGFCYPSINTWGNTDASTILLQPNMDGSLDLWCNSNAISKSHYGSFSYPVAE